MPLDRISYINKFENKNEEAFHYVITDMDNIFSENVPYLYEGWGMMKNWKKYLGSCKSKKYKEMLRVSSSIVMEVTAVGSKIQMAELERERLLKVDAKNNPKYFNQTNGGGKYLMNLNRGANLAKRILAGEFDNTREDISIEELNKLTWIQGRGNQLITDHKNDIRDGINENKGNQKWINNNLRVHRTSSNDGIGGNHCFNAAKECKYSENLTIPTYTIPIEEFEGFTEADWVGLCNGLNKPEKEISPLPSNKEDALRELVLRCDEGQLNFENYKDESVLKCLKETYNITLKKNTDWIFKKVFNYLVDCSDKNLGRAHINWGSKEGKERKKKIKEKYEENYKGEVLFLEGLGNMTKHHKTVIEKIKGYNFEKTLYIIPLSNKREHLKRFFDVHKKDMEENIETVLSEPPMSDEEKKAKTKLLNSYTDAQQDTYKYLKTVSIRKKEKIEIIGVDHYISLTTSNT